MVIGDSMDTQQQPHETESKTQPESDESITETDMPTTVYKVTNSEKPPRQCIATVKSRHAEEYDVPYESLSARKLAENTTSGHYVISVVEFPH